MENNSFNKISSLFKQEKQKSEKQETESFLRELNEEFDELEEDVINSPSEEEPDCSDDEELDDK